MADPARGTEGFDPRADALGLPGAAPPDDPDPDPRALRQLLPPEEPGRAIDDWGRSETAFQLAHHIRHLYPRY